MRAGPGQRRRYRWRNSSRSGPSSASGLNDGAVKTALVVTTTKHAAENWLEPGAISPTAADPRAYLVVLAGRFICTRCSYPAGAKPPRGRSAQIVWIPGQGVTDFGLTERVPGGLDRLGRAVKINLVAPAVQAPDLARTRQRAYHRCRGEHLRVRGTAGGFLNITNLRVSRISCSRAAVAVRASSYEPTPGGPLFTSPRFDVVGQSVHGCGEQGRATTTATAGARRSNSSCPDSLEEAWFLA